MSMTAHLNNLRFSLKILDSSFFGRGRRVAVLFRGMNLGSVGRDGMFGRDRRFAIWSLWCRAGGFFMGSGGHNGYLVVGLEDVTACRALYRQFFRKSNEYILGPL